MQGKGARDDAFVDVVVVVNEGVRREKGEGVRGRIADAMHTTDE